MGTFEPDEPTSLEAEDDLAISVRDLHVRYLVYEDRQPTFREALRRGMRGRKSVEVHALKGVSFDIRQREAVGVIGSNGSGKSTLLRAMAGMQTRSAGSISVRGRPQLLGVGAALRPELSGYRNIILGGLALGLSLDEVRSRADEAHGFSGLGEAIWRPMSTYSSGMRARLVFSIVTLQSPRILLIDEALAVGDRAFQERSTERIREIREEANTVVLVTHNLNEVRDSCTRVIWLEGGILRQDGPVDEVLDAYQADEA